MKPIRPLALVSETLLGIQLHAVGRIAQPSVPILSGDFPQVIGLVESLVQDAFFIFAPLLESGVILDSRADLAIAFIAKPRSLRETTISPHGLIAAEARPSKIAAGMIMEGMTTEGLSIIRGIHERYNPAKHNPWNSILCGDHYSRDMASWGCLLAAGGYTCDGPAGKIGFAPRILADDFRSFFTTAEGWGSLQQIRRLDRQSNRIELRWGRLRLKTLQLEIPPRPALRQTAVTVAGQTVECEVMHRGHRVTIALKQPLLLEPGRPLEVEFRF